jgi:hypothetical protein
MIHRDSTSASRAWLAECGWFLFALKPSTGRFKPTTQMKMLQAERQLDPKIDYDVEQAGGCGSAARLVGSAPRTVDLMTAGACREERTQAHARSRHQKADGP